MVKLDTCRKLFFLSRTGIKMLSDSGHVVQIVRGLGASLSKRPDDVWRLSRSHSALIVRWYKSNLHGALCRRYHYGSSLPKDPDDTLQTLITVPTFTYHLLVPSCNNPADTFTCRGLQPPSVFLLVQKINLFSGSFLASADGYHVDLVIWYTVWSLPGWFILQYMQFLCLCVTERLWHRGSGLD